MVLLNFSEYQTVISFKLVRLGIDSDTVSVDDVLEDKELAFPGVLAG